jgi:hypothetical protein
MTIAARSNGREHRVPSRQGKSTVTYTVIFPPKISPQKRSARRHDFLDPPLHVARSNAHPAAPARERSRAQTIFPPLRA